MNRMLAIVEREMRKFFRSPALMMVSMIFPLVQLIVLGNAFGGKIRDATLGLVDQDGGTQALKIREAFDSVRANMRTFEPIYYTDQKQAMEDVRNGKIEGAVIIPPQYSRRVYEQDQPQIALVVDNSDNFMSAALEDELSQITNALNNPAVEPRLLQKTVLQIVELYPYIEYMKFLLPGSITLAIFMSVMIGGGMLYIDDKARGVHEGYLVTPITKAELVFGLNAASVVKAVMVGVVITVVGCLLAGVGTLFSFSTALGLLSDDCADRGGLEYDDVSAGGQFLHAGRLAFPHPFRDERVDVESPLPPDLTAALERARLESWIEARCEIPPGRMTLQTRATDQHVRPRHVAPLRTANDRTARLGLNAPRRRPNLTSTLQPLECSGFSHPTRRINLGGGAGARRMPVPARPAGSTDN